MNKRERELAAKMLDLVDEEFGNHGCNDVDEETWDGWTKRQRQAFVKAYHEWNGDPEEYHPDRLHLPDFAIMAFLAFRLRKEEGK